MMPGMPERRAVPGAEHHLAMPNDEALKRFVTEVEDDKGKTHMPKLLDHYKGMQDASAEVEAQREHVANAENAIVFESFAEHVALQFAPEAEFKGTLTAPGAFLALC